MSLHVRRCRVEFRDAGRGYCPLITDIHDLPQRHKPTFCEVLCKVRDLANRCHSHAPEESQFETLLASTVAVLLTAFCIFGM